MVFVDVLPISPIWKILFLIIGLLLDVLAFSVRFYSYIMMPIIRNKKGVVELSTDDSFVFAPSNNAIIVRDGGSIFASVFIKIPIYKSGTEMLDQDKETFSRAFGNLVTISKTPIRFTSQFYIINKDSYVTKIRDKLNESEEAYRNIETVKDARQEDIARAKGELTMWHNMHDNIIKTQSYSMISYVVVSAEGGTSEEAVNMALQYSDEAIAGIGAILGVTPSVVSGEEILLFMEPDYTIPISTITEQIKQKTLSEGGA